MPNYRRSNTSGATFFFTLVTFQRRKILTNEQSRFWLLESVVKTRDRFPFLVDAWVLLPDHMHCMWTLPEGDFDFSIRWNGIKSRFTKLAKNLLHKPELMSPSKHKHRESTIWQRRFWEHQIRDDNDYEKHMNYIHYNPVKHSYVNKAADWPYSSFHRYVRNEIYSPTWGHSMPNKFAGEYGE